MQVSEKERVSLNDFSMLSLIGVGNYAKVILVRKKSSSRIYAMKIVKKRKDQETEIKGLKKTHAYIEKDILVVLPPRRVPPRTRLSSNFTRPSSDSANSIIFSSIVQEENFSA